MRSDFPLTLIGNGSDYWMFMEIQVKENTSCYASKTQQCLLHKLAEIRLINDHFFLTGGTALSVFYLYHRIIQKKFNWTGRDRNLRSEVCGRRSENGVEIVIGDE